MESLTETPWDVIISGTGLTQSLLALALSRSDKKVLHVDKNPYYGGPEAAFSLQEAQDWAAKVSEDPEQGPFEDASVYSPEQFEGDVKLSSPRAYTLSLSPHLIYSRSSLLPTLISSKVYRQLEFQAVGSWWIQKQSTGTDTADQSDGVSFSLYRVPGTREDVFADDLITVKSKRTLMRFLRHISKDQQGGQEPSEQEDLSVSLPSYLVSKFQVPDELHSPLQSLSLSQKSPKQTPADYAVPRIKRHLASIGVLGPGFGSLLAKWGGDSEIAQVGCRALAVGGGTYVLGAGIHSITDSPDPEDGRTRVQLSNGETVRTKFVVGSHWDLPAQAEERQLPCDKVARSISVVSSSLDSLFAATAEGAPIPAGTIVVFPGNLLGQGDDSPPVYLQAHSSDTGEVPTGQSVIYGSVSVPGPRGQSLLESAVNRLLQSTDDPTAKVLWSLRYTQLGRYNAGVGAAQDIESDYSTNIICLPPPSLDLAFDDTMIGVVKAAWKVVMGGNVADEEFMKFEDREGACDEE